VSLALTDVADDFQQSQILVLICRDGEPIFGRWENDRAEFSLFALDFTAEEDGLFLGTFDFLGRWSEESERGKVLFDVDKGVGTGLLALSLDKGDLDGA
jgi:hypothetical protein